MGTTVAATHRLLDHRVAIDCEAAPRVAEQIARLLARFRVRSGTAEVHWSVREHATTCAGPRFVVARDGEQVRRSQRAGDACAFILHALHTAALASVADTHLLLHGGAVQESGAGLVVVGLPGAGKTTLTAALVRSGLDLVADEATPLDLTTTRLRPYPRHLDLTPRALSLVEADGRHPCREEPRDLDGPVLHVLAEDLRPGAVVPCDGGEVRMLVLTSHRPGAAMELQPVGRAEAVAELAMHTFFFPRLGGCGLDVLARVVREATVVRLVAGDLATATAALRRRFLDVDTGLAVAR